MHKTMMRFFKSFTRRFFFTSSGLEMAKSNYEYVRKFEVLDSCLPNTWIVVRLDGRSFHRFSEEHDFVKPNDERALSLMNLCGECLMRECGGELLLSYGQSDEYSFVFRRNTNLFRRRASKLMTVAVSHFTSSYVFHWTSFFPTTPLKYPPTFDGRVILYPSLENVRDYLSWRQVDCHINNLHNTCFWALVHAGKTKEEADKELCGTFSQDKNELLFSNFSINYNNLPQIFRKGSVLLWGQDDSCTNLESISTINEVKVNVTSWEETDDKKFQNPTEVVKPSQTLLTASGEDSLKSGRGKCKNNSKKKTKRTILTLHEDIIGETFWTKHPHILQ